MKRSSNQIKGPASSNATPKLCAATPDRKCLIQQLTQRPTCACVPPCNCASRPDMAIAAKARRGERPEQARVQGQEQQRWYANVIELLAQLSSDKATFATVGDVYAPYAPVAAENCSLLVRSTHRNAIDLPNVYEREVHAMSARTCRKAGRPLVYVSRWDACVAAARANCSHICGPKLARPSDARVGTLRLRIALSLSASGQSAAIVPRRADIAAARRLVRKQQKKNPHICSHNPVASETAGSESHDAVRGRSAHVYASADALDAFGSGKLQSLPLFAPSSMVVTIGNTVGSNGNIRPRVWRPTFLSKAQLDTICRQIMKVNAEDSASTRRLERAGGALAALRRLRSQWQDSGVDSSPPTAGAGVSTGGGSASASGPFGWEQQTGDEEEYDEGDEEGLGQEEENELARELLGEEDDGLSGLAARNDTGPLPGSNVGGRFGLLLGASSVAAWLFTSIAADLLERVAIATPPGRAMLGYSWLWPDNDRLMFVTTLEECIPRTARFSDYNCARVAESDGLAGSEEDSTPRTEEKIDSHDDGWTFNVGSLADEGEGLEIDISASAEEEGEDDGSNTWSGNEIEDVADDNDLFGPSTAEEEASLLSQRLSTGMNANLASKLVSDSPTNTDAFSIIVGDVQIGNIL